MYICVLVFSCFLLDFWTILDNSLKSNALHSPKPVFYFGYSPKVFGLKRKTRADRRGLA